MLTMKILNHKFIKLSISKSGKGEPFHWKILPCPHRESMASLSYDKDETYVATHYFVTPFIQLFWLWFVIGIELPKERLSSTKYVNYEATHYASIDEVLN